MTGEHLRLGPGMRWVSCAIVLVTIQYSVHGMHGDTAHAATGGCDPDRTRDQIKPAQKFPSGAPQTCTHFAKIL
jgi:hypothetical protein